MPRYWQPGEGPGTAGGVLKWLLLAGEFLYAAYLLFVVASEGELFLEAPPSTQTGISIGLLLAVPFATVWGGNRLGGLARRSRERRRRKLCIGVGILVIVGHALFIALAVAYSLSEQGLQTLTFKDVLPGIPLLGAYVLAQSAWFLHRYRTGALL